jgi:hypothetical protein
MCVFCFVTPRNPYTKKGAHKAQGKITPPNTKMLVSSQTVYDEASTNIVDPAFHIPGPWKSSTPTVDERVIGAPTVNKEAYI